MPLVSLSCVSNAARSSGGAFCFATTGGVPSFFAACAAGGGDGTFAAGGVGLIARGAAEALVEVVAAAPDGSLVAVRSCAAAVAGAGGRAAGWPIVAPVSAPLCGEAVGAA